MHDIQRGIYKTSKVDVEMERDVAKKQRLPFRNRDTIQNQMVSQSDMTVLQQCWSLL